MHVYILLCSDNTLYIGASKRLADRLDTHNAGKGAKYTRSRLPVSALYCEECRTWEEALSREHALKKLSRQRKIQLIKETYDDSCINLRAVGIKPADIESLS